MRKPNEPDVETGCPAHETQETGQKTTVGRPAP